MRGRVAFLTAARSEYDILFPVIAAVSRTTGLRADVIAAGAHLSPFHGMGVEQIVADGFEVSARVESLVSSDSWEGRALSFAHLTEGLTRALSAARPDVLFVAGDREEALAGAIAAAFLRVTTAHVHGGDRCFASDIDEVLRPAISKLAHLHFTATEGHRERLIKMGEDPARAWAVGAPGIDRLRSVAELPVEHFRQTYGVDVARPFFLLIQHPSPMIEGADTGEEMRVILDAVLAQGVPVFCSYPNQDPHNYPMRRAIDAARATSPAQLVVYHNLPRAEFVTLYRRCAGILGNSSSIVIESGYFKKPGVLIGPRQDLRETGPNVVRVAIEPDAIRDAARRCLADAEWLRTVADCPSPYGDGHAGERIAQVLARFEPPADLHLKTMPY